jgi:hypothetical protein
MISRGAPLATVHETLRSQGTLVEKGWFRLFFSKFQKLYLFLSSAKYNLKYRKSHLETTNPSLDFCGDKNATNFQK